MNPSSQSTSTLTQQRTRSIGTSPISSERSLSGNSAYQAGGLITQTMHTVNVKLKDLPLRTRPARSFDVQRSVEAFASGPSERAPVSRHRAFSPRNAAGLAPLEQLEVCRHLLPGVEISPRLSGGSNRVALPLNRLLVVAGLRICHRH